MTRKKNPEQTIENIIAVSEKLFLETGYEKTSMQDIVNALGMSKGAIFHHFKSKEDILHAVLNKQSEYMLQTYYKWLEETKTNNAREKIIALLEKSLKDRESRTDIDSLVSSQLSNHRFIVANMQSSVNKSAPILAKLLREGVKDGSITTQNPDECAEVFLLLFNTWCDHVLFECNINRLTARLQFIQQIMRQMGADILSDKAVKEYVKFIKNLYKRSVK